MTTTALNTGIEFCINYDFTFIYSIKHLNCRKVFWFLRPFGGAPKIDDPTRPRLLRMPKNGTGSSHLRFRGTVPQSL